MFKNLKRRSTAMLTLSVILIITCYLLVNYISYRHLLYADYVSKVSTLSKMHAENIDSYFNQLSMSTSLFFNDCKDDYTAAGIRTYSSAQIKDVMLNIAKYRSNSGLSDIVIFNTSGEYASHLGRLNGEALKKCGILKNFKEKKRFICYTPDEKIYINPEGKKCAVPSSFVYGEAVYSAEGSPVFYVFELINMNYLKSILSTDEYFTKETTVYLDFGENAYNLSDGKRVSSSTLDSKNHPPFSEKNTFTTRQYNRNYNVFTVAKTGSSDNSLFINMIKPIAFAIILIVGTLCFLCARLIVKYMMEPLETINIKMKHFK